MGPIFKNLLAPRMSNLALMHLCQKKAFEQLNSFCEKFSVKKMTDEGLIPLHVAAAVSPYPETVEILIENGANVNQKDEQGFTALHIAAVIPNLKILEKLLDNGADPNALTVEGANACQMSLQWPLRNQNFGDEKRLQAHFSACDFLVGLTSPNNMCKKGQLLVRDISRLNLKISLKKLLNNGCTIPNDDFNEESSQLAIMHAVVYNYNFFKRTQQSNNKNDAYDILELLLRNGGNPNECLKNPRRYLLDECRGDQKLTTLLKSFGARGMNE